ncbi:MAG TPA: ferric reductase [Candidatus Micrarchaeia archaeon]|nr:ferric reductase [Candidatus Micrarchaeia archaeon]
MTTTDLWYVSRGSGLVLLGLLTATIVLGAVVRSGWTPRGWPRFVVQGLHRNLALLAVALLCLHVLTAELDPYVPIGWLSLVLPFASPYRTVWMAMGTIALELLAAVVVTSLVRRFLSATAWRSVHMLVVAAWPLTLAHVIGMGPDVAIPAIAAGVVGCAAIGLAALSALGTPRSGVDAVRLTAGPGRR